MACEAEVLRASQCDQNPRTFSHRPCRGHRRGGGVRSVRSRGSGETEKHGRRADAGATLGVLCWQEAGFPRPQQGPAAFSPACSAARTAP